MRGWMLSGLNSGKFHVHINQQEFTFIAVDEATQKIQQVINNGNFIQYVALSTISAGKVNKLTLIASSHDTNVYIEYK